MVNGRALRPQSAIDDAVSVSGSRVRGSISLEPREAAVATILSRLPRYIRAGASSYDQSTLATKSNGEFDLRAVANTHLA